MHCNYRYKCLQDRLKRIEDEEGGLDEFTTGYKYYGLHQTTEGGIVCREWAPSAEAVYLRGDFSEFNLMYIIYVL